LVIRRGIHRDIHAGQFADDRCEALYRQGDRAGFLHLGLDLAADAEIEIRGGEGNLVLLRFNEHIAQDGHGGFGADHVEHLGEAVGEMIAIDFEFHGCGAEGSCEKLTKSKRIQVQ
jgi:hypothetical protein